MKEFLEQEESVRRYLQWLTDPSHLVDSPRIEQLRDEAGRAVDPLDRLRILAEIHHLERISEDTYREAFVRHAKEWADANFIPVESFLEMGVDVCVLKEAGFTPSSDSRSAPDDVRDSRPELGRRDDTHRGILRAGREQIQHLVMSLHGEFTVADVTSALGGTTETARKAIYDLIHRGVVENLGPVNPWNRQGRAPIRFRTTGRQLETT